MALIQEYKQRNAQEPELVVPQLNVAQQVNPPVPSGLEQQLALSQQAPVASDPMPEQVVVPMPEQPNLETLAAPSPASTLDEQTLNRELQVSDIPLTQYPVLFNSQPPQTFNFTPFPKYEPQQQVPLTSGVSVPADPSAPFDSTREVGEGANPWWKSSLEWAGRAASYVGNVTTAAVVDYANRANKSLEAFPDAQRSPLLAPITNFFEAAKSRVAQYFDAKKEDDELTWEDYVPTVKLSASRDYTAEALTLKTEVTATEEVGKVGLPGRSPIGTYQPKFDRKDKWAIDPSSNPTWWAGLGMDFITGIVAGLGLERPAVQGVGKLAGIASKGSAVATSTAKRAAEVLIDPVGELVLEPAVGRAVKGVVGVTKKLLPPAAKSSRVFISTPGTDGGVTFAKPTPLQSDEVVKAVPPRSFVALPDGKVAEVTGYAGENLMVKTPEGTQVVAPWDIKRVLNKETVITPAPVAPVVDGAATVPVLQTKRGKVDLVDGTTRTTSSASSVPAETRKAISEFVNGDKPVFEPVVIENLPPSVVPTKTPGVVISNPELPSDIPAVDKRVFTGTMTLKDFSNVVAEQVPGTQVDVKALSQTPRTLQQLHALARRVYKDGQPIISERVPRTYTELYGKLDRLQLPPSQRKLFDRYGYPIPEEALNAPDFRIVIQEELPAAKRKEVSVLQTNRKVAQDKKLLEEVPVLEGAKDVQFKDGMRVYKVEPTYKKPTTSGQVYKNIENEIKQLKTKAQVMRDMGNVKLAQKLELEIAAKEAQLSVPDVKQPDQLRIVQKEVLPPEFHGTSDEVVNFTDMKITTEVELKDLNDTITELNAHLEDMSANLDASANRVIETVDVGRKLPNEELPVNPRPRIPPMVRDSIEEGITSRPNEGTWFHGTRVKGLTTDIDPVTGGKRAEWGTGMYLTRDPQLADGYARADVSPNVPGSVPRNFSGSVGEVIEYEIPHDHVSIYAHRPFTVSQAIVLRDVAEENLGVAAGRNIMKLIDKKVTLSQALDELDRMAAKKGFTEAQLTKISREIGMGFRDDGIDVLYDGNTAVIYNPSLMREVNRSAVDLSNQNPLEVAGHRFNVESARAAQNPDSMTAQVDFEEASVRLQAELKNKLETDVHKLEKQRSQKLRELLDHEDALEEAAAKERYMRAQELTEKARAVKEKELKMIDELLDPCEP